MPNINTKLIKSRRKKDDEYYTNIKDIEAELPYYKQFFENKTVYCNCDEIGLSKFIDFFIAHFQEYKLKELIATHFVPQQANMFLEQQPKRPKLFRMTHPHSVRITNLKGDGDFRSSECMSIMRQADIVVTNPPFSIIREYLAKLFETKVDFLIIAPVTVTSAVHVNPYLCNNQIWGGVHYGRMEFIRPTGTEALGHCIWFTNLDHNNFPEDLELTEEYSENKYPHYDNIDAIDCSISKKIPKDYDGIIGVPVSWIEHHNRKQFRIVGQIDAILHDKRIFRRLLIKNNNPN